MSYGLLICSECHKEVHRGVTRGIRYYHCEDMSNMCTGATAIYPDKKEDIQGPYCGNDDLYGEFA